MRRGSRHLAGAGIAAAAILALVGVAVPAGSSATKPKPYWLKLKVTKGGFVRYGKSRVRCHAATACVFAIQVGTRKSVRLQAIPSAGWKFTGWSGCKSATGSCKLSLPHKGTVGVTFIRPGARANPIPLHRAWKVGLGWTIQVMSVTPDARGLVIDNASGAPHQAASGAQLLMLDVAATYSGGGDPSLAFANNWYVKGGGYLLYLDGSDCGPSVDVSLPAPDLQTKIKNNQAVRTGQTVTGNVCFEVPSDVASALLLNATYGDAWFALR